jgi:protein-S-isoprenylcysteine O-methyltransferase Ste14
MPRIQPPVYLLLAIIAMFGLHWLLPVAQLVHYPWTLLGLIPVVIGFLIGMAGSVKFRQVGTTIVPGQVSSTLVTGGVFGFSRNPIYLGMLLALAGIWLLLGSLSPVVMVPLFWLALNQTIIPLEERMLTERFGDEYRAYQRRVRRWL